MLARSAVVGVATATGVVAAGWLVAAAKRCIDSPDCFNWTPMAYAWGGSAAIVIGALALRTNSGLAVPLLVLGAICSGSLSRAAVQGLRTVPDVPSGLKTS